MEDAVGRSDFMGVTSVRETVDGIQTYKGFILTLQRERRLSPQQQAAPKPSHKCTYTGCGHIFSIQYQLRIYTTPQTRDRAQVRGWKKEEEEDVLTDSIV